ncbi:acyltransferase [Paenibacillus segetis]|uniref:Acyltransferase n=1 Tax=Paenibacillus segetis TaxID=1325360 RepID=A0ABQ1YTJ8_9BACL|nr:acyltransferase [Paenibacillus segetis]GGH38195.1 hypothetical protein GCM10008013_46120 [Paenibacillus segetis]
MSLHISPETAAKFMRFGQNNAIHAGGQFYHPEEIVIGLEKNVKLGRRVFISDTDHVYQDIGKPILTQDLTETTGRVWIGEGTIIEHGVVISGNISIGPGSLIRANSLVEQDIPANSIAEGIPARIVGSCTDK